MKKIIIILISILIVSVIAGGATIWYLMQQPLYKPGIVRAGENLRASLEPPEQPENSPMWRVEADIDLLHFAEGEGRNVLIVHGGPGMPYLKPWPGLTPLTGSYRFHYYDQRGCGQSTRPFDTFASTNYYQNMTTLEQTLGLGAQIADIERIRRLLGDEKLILIGHSWGGFLASLYAAEFPEHVEALILVSPADVLVMPQPSGGLFELVKQRLPAEKQTDFNAFLAEYLNFGDIFTKSEADLIALNQEFGQYYLATVDSPLPQQGRPGGWMVHAMYFSMGQRHDYREPLRAVTVPVLVIHGAKDLQPEEVTRLYAETLPNARFQIIENAGHFSFLEQPDLFAQTVSEFLADLP
ncbi:MAG: 2-succinyl-6-hydroxy-2,4-cyclohexadiene-1-carboxylate synthase [Anaerolineae bacterium]|nr:2-succinyl-6-hydroxy-2,4-cyclohexadiene-1-carboxylate synthase [Anaerolineae bacterium]